MMCPGEQRLYSIIIVIINRVETVRIIIGLNLNEKQNCKTELHPLIALMQNFVRGIFFYQMPAEPQSQPENSSKRSLFKIAKKLEIRLP